VSPNSLRWYSRSAAIVKAAVREPYEARERALENVSKRRDFRGRNARQVRPSPDWEEQLHRALGAPWPCAAHDDFEVLYAEIVTSLHTRGLATGRAAYGGWDDGEAALARTVWCATLHSRPSDAVETGVARGITSRCILEAMGRNACGRLWSIDLPPLVEPELRRETGAAVPDDRRDRWRYLEGSSRKRLPALIGVLGEFDLFVHDSMHTTRNVAFELACAWPALRPGGIAIVDDVEQNAALASFAAAHPDEFVVTGLADDAGAAIGVAVKSLTAAS
jgi:predicted O-methyltransferase YrrM